MPMSLNRTSAITKLTRAAAKHVHPAALNPTMSTSGESAASVGCVLLYFAETAVDMLDVTARPIEVPI